MSRSIEFSWKILAVWLISCTTFGENAQSLPSAVDLRPRIEEMGLAPERQGKRPTCTLFAVKFIAEYELARARGDETAERLSPEFLVWASNEACGTTTDSAMTYEILHALQEIGLCRAEWMPYRSEFDPEAEVPPAAIEDAATRRGWRPVWIKHWEATTGLTDEQIAAAKRELADGHPINAGMRWPKRAKLSDDHVLNTPRPDGVRDGHSVVWVGFRDDAAQPGGGLFIFRNTSGPKWGDGGYGYLTYDYARKYVNNINVLHVDADMAGESEGRIHYEAEDLPIVEVDCDHEVVRVRRSGGKLWGNGRYLLARTEQGDAVELEFVVSEPGRYRVDLQYAVGPEFGHVQAALDGISTGKVVDSTAGRIFPSGPVTLGEVELAAGKHRLHLRSVGKSQLSRTSSIAIDAIDLVPVE